MGSIAEMIEVTLDTQSFVVDEAPLHDSGPARPHCTVSKAAEQSEYVPDEPRYSTSTSGTSLIGPAIPGST